MRRSVALLALFLLAMLGVVPPASAGTVTASVVGDTLTVTGATGDDAITVRCEGGELTVNQAQPTGGPEACGGLRRLIVSARGGDDHVSLGEVAPSVFDSLGTISVAGEDGDDTLVGSKIADVLSGGAGVDSLRGGAGSDELSPGSAGGEAFGGPGRDIASVSGDGIWSVIDGLISHLQPFEETALHSIEEVEVEGGEGRDTITATFSGSVILFGRGGDDLLSGGPSNDDLDGGGGNDWLDSGEGNDLLEGRVGNDILRGGNGNDVLRGGPGADDCLGGPGADSQVSC